MKTGYVVTIILVLALIGVLVWSQSGTRTDVTQAPEQTPTPTQPQEDSIVGCYAVTNGKDVYTLNILLHEGSRVTGLLSFKNFEKDSSSGTFAGTYNNGILIGDYSFQSEGTNSIMQVAFKKQGNDFIRGYGDLNDEGTRFTNPSALTYDSTAILSVFKKTTCS